MIVRIHQDTGADGPTVKVIAMLMVCSLVLPILARYRPAAPRAATNHELPKTA